MVQTSRTFRIFVSSTFSDLKEERNALQKYVFPQLREFCMEHGCRFQAIDLRWGISDEAGYNHQTMKICLEEIARCQKTSPKPNFIILLGDRYGWQPVPSEIPADEFDEILKRVSKDDREFLLWDETQNGNKIKNGRRWNFLKQFRLGIDKKVSYNKGWYRKDENAIPPVYCLQPRTGDYKEHDNWEKVENRLRYILLNAISTMKLDEKARFKYVASATEQEIIHGSLQIPEDIPDAKEHVFGFFREITNLDEIKKDAMYIYEELPTPDESSKNPAKDFIDTKEKGDFDAEAYQNLQKLKEKLENSLEGNIHTYTAQWNRKGLTSDHIGILPVDVLEHMKRGESVSDPNTLCVAVWRRLYTVIKAEIDSFEQVESLDQEIAVHEEFGKERSRFFVGRENLLEKISHNIPGYHPVVVYGKSGSGKSALMAKAVELSRSHFMNAVVIVRFVGATPGSSDGQTLLEGMCREIAKKYGLDESSIPLDYQLLVKKFHEMLALATTEKPLIIYIDALDQLSNTSNYQSTDWLPIWLPDNVYVIVSTLHQYLGIFQKRIPSNYLLEITEMEKAESEILLNNWLRSIQRTLQPAQQEEILKKFKLNGLPLYIKLVFEEARWWKSYTMVQDLKPDIPGIIHDMLIHLSSESKHGEMIVSRSLGYLAAAKNGLSEDELIDILSDDNEVYKYFIEHTYHRPPEKKLPVVLWSRLYFDLEPYLMERNVEGTFLLSFYHRQLREEVEKEYLHGEDSIKRHKSLAQYFGNQPLTVGSNQSPNIRKVSELPYQQTYGEMVDSLNKTLTDIIFIENKCTAGLIYDLENDYRRIGIGHLSSYSETNITESETGPYVREHTEKEESLTNISELLDKEILTNYYNALIFVRHHIKLYPHNTFQYMYNDLWWKKGRLEKCLEKTRVIYLEKGGKFLRQFRKPIRFDSMLHTTLTGHTRSVNTCAFSPDGKQIVSGSDDKTIKLWNVDTGNELVTLTGHTGSINTCAFSPDGKWLVSGSDDKMIKLWDEMTGKELATFTEENSVEYCAFSPDCYTIVSDNINTTKIWNVFTGKTRYVWKKNWNLFSEGKLVQSLPVKCFLSPDFKFMVLIRNDHTSSIRAHSLEIINLNTGKKHITDYRNEKNLMSADFLTFSLDGKRIVLLLQNQEYKVSIKILETSTGKEIATLSELDYYVLSCSFSPDGIHIVFGCNDGTLRLWDADMGKELMILKGHNGPIKSCSFSPDGINIVSGSMDKTLKLWNYNVKESSSLSGHKSRIKALAFSPDGKYVVSGSEDKTLKIWDSHSGIELKTLIGHNDEVTCCCFSPDGSRIVSSSKDKTIKIWNRHTGSEFMTLSGHISDVTSCTFSPDGSQIVSGSCDTTLKIWNAETGKEITTLKGHDSSVESCSISPDGKLIVSGCYDNSLKLWDTRTKKEIKSLNGHSGNVSSCTFSPDCKFIISGSYDNSLKLWEVQTGKEIRTLNGHKNSVNSCSFSSDGRLIVSGGFDSTLKLWDGQTGKELITYSFDTEIFSVCFSPKGNIVACGDFVGNFYLFDLEGFT